MNLSDFPLVSIIIPVYNGSNYLHEAIDSALAQTYRNVEVLVVNDGSNDGGLTRNIALSYGEKIRYFEKINGGVSSALNYGIRNMRGDYFSWLSHDDVYLPKKIEKQIDLLKKADDPKCIAKCALQLMDENGQLLYTKKRYKNQQFAKKISWEEALKWHIEGGSFGGCNLLIPKKAFEECGLFDESLRYVQDFIMWMRFFWAKYSLIVSDEILVHNRVHKNQLTQTGSALFQKESVRISGDVIPKLCSISTDAYHFLYMYAMYHATYGNREIVSACMEAAGKENLLSRKEILRLQLQLSYGAVRPAIRKLYYRIIRRK